MAESLASVQANQAAFNAATLQLAETSILTNAMEANNASDVSALDQAGFNDSLQQATADASLPPAANNNDIGAEGLLGLNTTTLSLFNEIGLSHISTDPENLDITGNLSAQQLQELNILRQDVQLLEEASVLGNHVPLNENAAATLDLSVQAQGIAAGGALPVTETAASTQTAPATLTQEQLALTAQIITPYLNQPLTPALLAQIQAELQANMINPIEISLSILLLVQNYIASMQTVPEAKNVSEEDEETEISVDPVSSVDAVGVEDSAIL